MDTRRRRSLAIATSHTLRLVSVVALVVGAAAATGRDRLRATAVDHLAFAVIGDFGTGSSEQYELAQTMAATRMRVPYSAVLTVGDNVYGRWSRKSVAQRFETPYRPLLDAGVTFFATLGNHDDPAEREYLPFNMHGRRYYATQLGSVALFALDSNNLDAEQLAWLAGAVSSSDAAWKIAFFHHPLYSSGRRHGPAPELRAALEPLFVAHGVQVVFSGHDHVYERVKPQQGITYFVCGSSGQLRRGNLSAGSEITAAGFDADLAFIVVQIDGERLHFDAVSRLGAIVDSGDIMRQENGSHGPAER